MKFSKFGEKLTKGAGIVSLMEDLGDALRVNPDLVFMGGGNPSRIPEVEAVFQQQLLRLAQDSSLVHDTLGVYQSPQGEPAYLKSLAKLLRNSLGWPVSERNIALSNGSQAAFFTLFNLFGGEGAEGEYRQVQLPLCPEYIGYADVGVHKNLFAAQKPSIDLLDKHLFKYRVDFSRLEVGDSIGAICVSRPTNPTGNVLSDDEIYHLDKLARQKQIPLIIDGAYGLPFPNILFVSATPHWNENTIVVLSLSKLGLPGVRTGIIVANEEVIRAFTQANTILSLANGNLGPALTKNLMDSSEILSISSKVINPFYRQRAEQVVTWFQEALQGLPFYIHKSEGAIFLWLWFKGLPISSEELYRRLKKRGVLIMAGQDFFVGIDDHWPHKHECIRVNYAQDKAVVKKGVELIAEELRSLYS